MPSCIRIIRLIAGCMLQQGILLGANFDDHHVTCCRNSIDHPELSVNFVEQANADHSHDIILSQQVRKEKYAAKKIQMSLSRSPFCTRIRSASSSGHLPQRQCWCTPGQCWCHRWCHRQSKSRGHAGAHLSLCPLTWPCQAPPRLGRKWTGR